MKRIFRFAAAVLVALPLFAGNLGKYSTWADSPQGWFMTKAEREQWATLASEADAEKFIAGFLAKRDPKFAEEIATRVKKADQYFTVGKTPGSEALRGKVIIVLGPPSSFDVATKKTRAGGRTGSVDMQIGASGDGMGAGRGGAIEVDEREAMKGGGSGDKIYTITYGAEQLPTGKGISVVLEVDAVSGKDKMGKRELAELNKVFEAIAEASIKNK